MALIVLDLDGTLVDSFPGIRLGLNRALADLGRPPRELTWVRRHVGGGARRLVAAAADGVLDSELLLERFRHHYDEVLTGHTKPYPGVDAALSELARKHTLAIASNKPLAWVERLVAHHGWRPLMAAVVGPESAGALKPDPAMLEVVLEVTGSARATALMVGDMPVDLQTASNAGISSVGIASGSTPAAELRRLGCVTVLTGVAQLPAWLATTEPWGRD